MGAAVYLRGPWIQEGFLEEVAHVQGSQVIGEQGMPTRGNRLCKGPEAGVKGWLLAQLELQQRPAVTEQHWDAWGLGCRGASEEFSVSGRDYRSEWFTVNGGCELPLKSGSEGHCSAHISAWGCPVLRQVPVPARRARWGQERKERLILTVPVASQPRLSWLCPAAVERLGRVESI